MDFRREEGGRQVNQNNDQNNDDEHPLLDLTPPELDLSCHRTVPSRYACSCFASCKGRPCLPQTSHALMKIQLWISLFWDVFIICVLAWITDAYLDPTEYEGRLFVGVAFSAKGLQVVSAALGLWSRERYWYGYIPYLVTQAVAGLSLLVGIAAVFVCWNQIEIAFASILPPDDVAHVREIMAWSMVGITWWKISNWYAFAVVYEYVNFIKKHKAPGESLNTSEETGATDECS